MVDDLYKWSGSLLEGYDLGSFEQMRLYDNPLYVSCHP